jgi:hypothetical protein
MGVINTILNFNSYTWINILLTVLFFIIVQTLFFLYIVSKQYDSVILAKAELIKLMAENNNKFKLYIDTIKEENIEELERNAAIANARRYELNKELVIKYCFIPANVVGGLLLLTILYSLFNFKGPKWTYIETISLFLIITSYLTELYFFFFIVKKYEMVGDIEILYNVSNSISQNAAKQL